MVLSMVFFFWFFFLKKIGASIYGFHSLCCIFPFNEYISSVQKQKKQKQKQKQKNKTKQKTN